MFLTFVKSYTLIAGNGVLELAQDGYVSCYTVSSMRDRMEPHNI